MNNFFKISGNIQNYSNIANKKYIILYVFNEEDRKKLDPKEGSKSYYKFKINLNTKIDFLLTDSIINENITISGRKQFYNFSIRDEITETNNFYKGYSYIATKIVKFN
jgi:hypothetical protein